MTCTETTTHRLKVCSFTCTCTWVVFVFAYLQLDQLLALLQDLLCIVSGAILQSDVVDGQQLIAGLQCPCPEGGGGRKKRRRKGGTRYERFCHVALVQYKVALVISKYTVYKVYKKTQRRTEQSRYLWAMLPFLMSEMMRGSPCFLLAVDMQKQQQSK